MHEFKTVHALHLENMKFYLIIYSCVYHQHLTFELP